MKENAAAFSTSLDSAVFSEAVNIRTWRGVRLEREEQFGLAP